ncbi:Zona pellucida domain-containing protein [Strongyloides ratti]|uniref:Zona pellucida domain-containing protein n=1 Tax=Strongyloides ratti TaxID=34506 RepID=A0A090L9H1_STRRB|nr:Zona pellucida domain-containing protein [Strongyloides ratti]CEF64763.1 Zona pellucida domain-containing protein [Strongyloides ratti]
MISISILMIIFYKLNTIKGEYQENSVIGVPKVVCEDNDVSLDIITSKPFIGNIFVKGHAKDDACKQSYSSNGTSLYSLPLGECGMQRLRTANPKGISFSVTIIVSFHPSGFITKNDKAYRIRCFYMEPEEIVTNSIEVSSLTTSEIQDEMPMPVCDYSVRKNSVDGPLLTYGNVGDIAYHVWECKGTSNIGMLIKKCYVADGDGDNHSIIDVNGCTTDKFLLSEVTYNKNLMKAYATSSIFKYADSNQLYFTCQIRLCQKQMGLCEGVTPPTCSTTKEFTSNKKKIEEDNNDTSITSKVKSTEKRSELVTSSNGLLVLKSGKNKREVEKVIENRNLMEIDVASPELLVLDQGEAVSFTHRDNYCIPNILLLLIPISLIVIIFLTSILTLMISNVVTKKNICNGICV